MDDLCAFYERLGITYTKEQGVGMLKELSGTARAPLRANMLSSEYCQRELVSEESFRTSFALMNEAGSLDSAGKLQEFLGQLGETVTNDEAKAMLEVAHRYMPGRKDLGGRAVGGGNS